MRTAKRVLHFILPLALGILIGFYIRGFKSLPNSPISSGQAGRNPAPAGTSATLEKSKASPAPEMAGFSVREIRAALEHLKDISDLKERESQFDELLRRWLKADAQGAFAFANGLEEGEMKQKAMTLMAEVVGQSDPQFLAQQTLTMPASRSREELIRRLAEVWSRTDVAAALAWVGQLSDGVDKNDALFTIRSQWAAQDPANASAQISQLPENSSTTGLIATVAKSWGAADLPKALEWANTLPETEKTLAMSTLAGIWTARDPQAAGNFVAQLPPGEAQNEAVKAVVSTWAEQNPAQTAAWVLQFPTGALQDQAIREIVSAWNTADPEGARNWAVQLPDSPARDTALMSLAASIAYWTPDRAATIVGLINDPSERESSIETIMRSWSEIDSKSAFNWFSGLNLNDDASTRIRSLVSTN